MSAPSLTEVAACALPTVLPEATLATLALDHRTGFVVSLVDGSLSIDDIVDASGMSPVESLGILASLCERRIVVLGPAAGSSKDASSIGRAAVRRPTYRVIAEGEDALGSSLDVAEAITLMDSARWRGKRHVAIVDEASGEVLDEGDARAAMRRGS